MVEDTRDTYGIKYIRKADEKKDEPAKADANTKYYLNTGAGGVGGRGKQVSQETYHNVEHLGGKTERVGDQDISTNAPIVSTIDRKGSSIGQKKIGEKKQVKTQLGASGRGGARAGTGGGQAKVEQAKRQRLTVSPAPKVDDDEGGDKAKSLAETVYYNNLIIKGMDSVSARLKTINFFLDKINVSQYPTRKVPKFLPSGELNPNWHEGATEPNPDYRPPKGERESGKGSIENEEGSGQVGRGASDTLDRNASRRNLEQMAYAKEQAKQGITTAEQASAHAKEIKVTEPKARDEVTEQKPKQSESGRGTASATSKFGINARGNIGSGKVNDRRFYSGDSTGKSRYRKTSGSNSNNNTA
jgi:hypothetical protein